MMAFTELSYHNEIGEYVELRVRNVGAKNPKATIQIEAEITPKHKRRKTCSISIPAQHVRAFLAAIT